jgi:hypothetical protein
MSDDEKNLRSLCASGFGGPTAEWAIAEIDRLRAKVARYESGLSKIADGTWNGRFNANFLLGRVTP